MQCMPLFLYKEYVMKKNLGLILLLAVTPMRAMEDNQAANAISNGILIIDEYESPIEGAQELDFSDVDKRLIPVEEMLNYAKRANLQELIDLEHIKQELEATPIPEYNVLCARVIRKSKKNGKNRVQVKQFMSEFIKIQQQMLEEKKKQGEVAAAMLKEAQEGGVIQEAAYQQQVIQYQQQVKQAAFARRSAYGASAVSFFTFLWGVISTYFAANPDCPTSSLLVNNTDLAGW